MPAPAGAEHVLAARVLADAPSAFRRSCRSSRSARRSRRRAPRDSHGSCSTRNPPVRILAPPARPPGRTRRPSESTGVPGDAGERMRIGLDLPDEFAGARVERVRHAVDVAEEYGQPIRSARHPPTVKPLERRTGTGTTSARIRCRHRASRPTRRSTRRTSRPSITACPYSAVAPGNPNAHFSVSRET